MKPITEKSDRSTAFTIIELLTVMSIIVILIGLLLPSLQMVKRYSKEVKQRAQFHSIEAALEMFSGEGEYGRYPDSTGIDGSATQNHYCGAMRLCEAMVGQDLAGFHPLSVFWADCTDGEANGMKLYANNPAGATLRPTPQENLRARKQPYLPPDRANANRLNQLYSDTGSAYSGDAADLFVLCDVYSRAKNRETGKGVGMPILYYKANSLETHTVHDPTGTKIPTDYDTPNGCIYNYLDNQDLVVLGLPPAGADTHPLAAPEKFYDVITNKKITLSSSDPTIGWPYNPNTYILISAGYDGVYGTDDDIFNFEK